MLPGFTNPLGSRKESVSLVTVCCLSASARGALFGTLFTPFGTVVPLACAAADAVLASLVRTRSAHDFGAAGFGGDFGVSGAVSAVPSTAAASACTDATSLEAVDGCCGCFSTDGDAGFAFDNPPMLGTAIAVRVSLRACCCTGARDGLGEEVVA
jgi:hypothetical protein